MSDALGLIGDVLNWGNDLAFGIADRVHAKNREAIEDQRYNDQFEYQKQMDAQAQQNFNTQMEFQKGQAEFQNEMATKNFEQQVKQFEANRIGNLTEEYKEAGLNPFLAAGMGQSTASVVGGGGMSNSVGSASRGNLPSKEAHNLTPQTSPQFYLENMRATAEANKLNAEAELAKTQAEDIKETRGGRIEELEKKIDKIAQDIAESKAREKNTNVVTEKVELENQMLSNKLVESNYRADCFRLLEDTKGKKLSKLQKRQIMSQLNEQTVENRFKTSMTVEQYVKSVCEVVQTATGVALDSKSIADLYSNASKIGFMAQ